MVTGAVERGADLRGRASAGAVDGAGLPGPGVGVTGTLGQHRLPAHLRRQAQLTGWGGISRPRHPWTMAVSIPRGASSAAGGLGAIKGALDGLVLHVRHAHPSAQLGSCRVLGSLVLYAVSPAALLVQGSFRGVRQGQLGVYARAGRLHCLGASIVGSLGSGRSCCVGRVLAELGPAWLGGCAS